MNANLITALVAVAAGAVASISGFGIGSILTPLLATWLGTKLAVAVVSLPHFIGTALRFWLIRKHVDRRILLSFGITSALGGLTGALLHVWLRSAILGYVLAALLVFAGVMGLTGLAQRMHFGRTTAWIAGAPVGHLRRPGRQPGRHSLRSAARVRCAPRRLCSDRDSHRAAGGWLSNAGLRGHAMAPHSVSVAVDAGCNPGRGNGNADRQENPGMDPRADVPSTDSRDCPFAGRVDVSPSWRLAQSRTTSPLWKACLRLCILQKRIERLTRPPRDSG